MDWMGRYRFWFLDFFLGWRGDGGRGGFMDWDCILVYLGVNVKE